jgi:hypothetical protein
VQELMTGIGFPMGRLPTAGDHHAWSEPVILEGNRSGQMHGEGHWANDTFCMIHKPDELAYVGLAHEVEYATERGVPVTHLSTLHELNSAQKMIDNLLVVCGRPPLGGEVILTASDNDPESTIVAELLLNLTGPALVFRSHVNVTMELGDWQGHTQLCGEEIGVPLNKVDRSLITLIYKGIVHLNGAPGGACRI